MTPVAARRALVSASAATPEPGITVHAQDRSVVLQVGDQLDVATGESLLVAIAAALDTGPERICIDLRGLRSWSVDGAAALVRCRALCANLPTGLHYRSGRGPGREALLAAYA